MDIINISTWTDIIQHFLPVFTAPTGQIFLHLVTGWVLCTARRTICGILPFADPLGTRSHDAFHRFFPTAKWTLSHLWKILAILLVKIFYPKGTIPLDIDDTLFYRAGRQVWAWPSLTGDGASTWRDPIRSTFNVVFARGLNLVVLTLRVSPPWGGEPIGLPVNMRLRRKDGPSHIDLAVSMLTEMTQWLPKRRFSCHCDGFYTALIERRPAEAHITCRMRKDAIIYDLPPKLDKQPLGGRRVRGERIPPPAQLTANITDWKKVKTVERGKKRKRLVWSKIVIWYNVSLKPVRLVISRDPDGKEKDDFLVTTDIGLSERRVVGGFAGRWSIEDTFRNSKQLLGAGQPQTFRRCGPERAAGVGLWLYSVVWLWYLRPLRGCRWLPRMPWYRAKSRPSFADALAALRRELWQERINFMFDNSIGHNKIPEFLITALCYAA